MQMNSTEIVLSLECGLLAVLLLSVVIGLIMNKRKNLSFSYKNGSNDLNMLRKYRISPQTDTKPIRQKRNVEQLVDPNLESRVTADECVKIDETSNIADSGRLFFTLKYEENRSVLKVKLIKGENLPILSPDASKAYVKVQMVHHETFGNSTTVVKNSVNTNYQKTYSFSLHPSKFVSSTIYFEISRFDRFSRKYDIGYVFVALAELQAQGVDLSREAFLNKDITCSYESKVGQRSPQVLWKKLSHAVHTGCFEELGKSRNESLQWDPYLVVQRYECSHSDASQQTNIEDSLPSGSNKFHNQRKSQEEEVPEWFSKAFNSSNDSNIADCGAPSGHNSKYTPSSVQTTTSLNTEFYRLVYSPSPRRRTSSEPITSWSIPETYRFPPSPFRVQTRAVVFESALTAKSHRRDRLHKLTSLSSNYREKVLRKYRKKSNSGRSHRLAGKISLYKSLYLGKARRHAELPTNGRTFKRPSKTSSDKEGKS